MPLGYLCPLVGIPPGRAGRESGSVAAPRGTVHTTLSNEAPTEKSLLARPRPGAARASLGARCRPVRRNPLSSLLRGRDTVADQACGLSLRAVLLSPRNPVDLCHFAHDALQRSPPPIDTAAPRQGVQSAARLPTLTQAPKDGSVAPRATSVAFIESLAGRDLPIALRPAANGRGTARRLRQAARGWVVDAPWSLPRHQLRRPANTRRSEVRRWGAGKKGNL